MFAVPPVEELCKLIDCTKVLVCTNCPVNLNLVYQMQKSGEIVKTVQDMRGKFHSVAVYAIYFDLAIPTTPPGAPKSDTLMVQWEFASKEDRDEAFNEVLESSRGRTGAGRMRKYAYTHCIE